MEAKNALANAKDAYRAAQAELAYSMALAGQSANSAYVAVQTAADKIERQKEKIKELSGEGDNNVIEAKTAAIRLPRTISLRSLRSPTWATPSASP